ncbi:MAG: T9SS type A sorting domain-containing protein [bacterium]|nr:T9SS type A sorting domain-containing protein [bacterium]
MKQFSWILLLSLALTGESTATPRWGDDFDWLGDTLAITVPMGMIAFGDTIVCHTPNNMFALLQTDNRTFLKLWQMNIPYAVAMPYSNYYTISNRFCHILRRGNRFYYGWPKAMIEWNGNDAPVYRGAIRNGLQFTPDTAFTAGDFIIPSSIPMSLYRSYKPVQVNNMILVADRIFRIDSLTDRIEYAGNARTNWYDSSVTEWAVRWPYAYGITTTHQIAVVKLDTTPPQTVHRFETTFQPVFCRIINDSLVMGGGWSVWSLENPRIPQFVGNNTRFPGIDYLWEEPVDSVWFGWRGPYFFLISLAQGLLAPMIADTFRRPVMNASSTPSCNVAKTNYGWLVQSNHVLYPEQDFFQLRQYRDAQHRQRLDSLWYYRQPVGFDSNYLAHEHYQHYYPLVQSAKEGKAFVTRGIRQAVLVADTVNARHQMRWLPQGIYQIAIDGEQVLGGAGTDRRFHLLTWSNSSWLDQIFTVPDSVTTNVELFRSNLVVFQGNTQYPFPVYRFQNGEMISDGVLPYQPITLRESSAILDIGDSIRWYLKQGGAWLPQNWSVPGSGYAFAEGDTISTSGGQIYALQRNTAPTLIVDTYPFYNSNGFLLQSKSYFLRQTPLDNYQHIYTRYDHTSEGWVERGVIMSGAPFLYYGSMLLTMTPGAISTYRMPPNNATPELIGTLPFDFALSNPYPNPFNSTITFQVDLPRSAMTEYAIYDALGREVYTQPSERLSPGSYTLHWNGHDNNDLPASSGVYFIQVRAGTFTAVKKIVMLK